MKDLFNEIHQGRRLKKDDQISGKIPFVMSGITNCGVVGYISNPVASFPKNSITVDIFGNTFYRNYDFGAGDDTGVYWNSEKNYSAKTMLFFATAIQKFLTGKFSYGKKLRSSQSKNFKIYLPTKNGEIDFEFIEKFITELESEHIKEIEEKSIVELEAYLTAAGLKDFILIDEEKFALENLNSCIWQKFLLKDLFGESTRGKRLKSDDRIEGNLPFVTAGETDEGISAYIGNEVRIFSKNTITIDMFGSAKYRNYNYGADDHIAVVHTEKISKFASIFVTAAIHKSSHNGQFHYGRNFYAKDADSLEICLPTKDGEIDYEFMEKFITAVQKIIIADVVKYSEEKISAYRKAANK